MTRRIFSSRFTDLSRIDTTNSKAAGFDWYLSNGWPNSTSYPNSVWPTAPTISPSNLTISNGALTINNDPGGFGYGIATAVANGASYTGRAFPAGFYIEFEAAFAAQTPGSGKVAAVWCMALEFLIGTAPGGKAGELDFIEAIPIAGSDVAQISMQTHEWTFSGAGAVNVLNGYALNQASPPISHNGMGNFWKFGTALVPAAINNGTGLVRHYWERQELTDTRQDYSASGVPNPVPGNASPAAGQFSTMDGQNMVIIIGADSTIPISIKSFDVWSR